MDFGLLILVLIILVLGMLSYFADPVVLLSKFFFRYESKLKQIMPTTSLKGKALFEQALGCDDENIRQVAKRGALVQWGYSFFLALVNLIFIVVFFKKGWGAVVVLSVMVLILLYWGMPFFRLWLRAKK